MRYDPNEYRQIGTGNALNADSYWLSPNNAIHPVLPSQYGQIVDEGMDIIYLEKINEYRPEPMHILAETVGANMGLKTTMGIKALAIALENIKVLDEKQADYGSQNIAAFGEYGVLVRVTDKHARLKNLLTNVKEPKNESILDTWLDISNYAIIATLCRKGEWL